MSPIVTPVPWRRRASAAASRITRRVRSAFRVRVGVSTCALYRIYGQNQTCWTALPNRKLAGPTRWSVSSAYEFEASNRSRRARSHDVSPSVGGAGRAHPRRGPSRRGRHGSLPGRTRSHRGPRAECSAASLDRGRLFLRPGGVAGHHGQRRRPHRPQEAPAHRCCGVRPRFRACGLRPERRAADRGAGDPRDQRRNDHALDPVPGAEHLHRPEAAHESHRHLVCRSHRWCSPRSPGRGCSPRRTSGGVRCS